MILPLLLFPLLLVARPYSDPSGFRVDLPEGWQAGTSPAGHIVFASPNPLEYAFVQPQLNRTADCAGLLRQTLSGAGSKFSGVEQLEVVAGGKGQATAKFVFQKRQARGAILCAETSSRSAMFYGFSAPLGAFEQRRAALVGILRSFAYTGKVGSGAPVTGNSSQPLALVEWREPNEMAYTISVPKDWRIQGGIRRMDATHYSNGVDMMSPDTVSDIRVGDPRLSPCQVPGPGAPRSNLFCQYQTGQQFAEFYFKQLLSRDFAIQPTKLDVYDRPDLARAAEAMPASFGTRMQASVAEVRWEGTRNGVAVAGGLFAQTTLYYAAQGQNFLVGTQSFEVRSFFGPPGDFARLAKTTGLIHTSMRINPTWWSQTQQINQEIARKTLDMMQTQAQQQQQSFWERMASSDRRREAVNDVLGGTVRLSDGAGNQYQAQAGSNYYFLDTQDARTASKPNDAVRRSDVWPSATVDLKPLEVIR